MRLDVSIKAFEEKRLHEIQKGKCNVRSHSPHFSQLWVD